MTADMKFIRSYHPKAEVLFSQFFKWWGVFLNGRPRHIGGPKGDFESPFAEGRTKAEAAANARKKLERMPCRSASGAEKSLN